jgi:CheY-like chemotaxis protein
VPPSTKWRSRGARAAGTAGRKDRKGPLGTRQKSAFSFRPATVYRAARARARHTMRGLGAAPVDGHDFCFLLLGELCWEGLDVRTVGVSFEHHRGNLGERVMSQRDARLERGYSSDGDSDRLPARPAQDEPESTAPAAIGHAKLRSVVLLESDQYYREILTVVLLGLGFVVYAFADGASLLGSLATAIDADLAVLDWDLSEMPGIKLLAELRRHSVNLPVVFLTDKVIAGDNNDHQGAVELIVKSRDGQVFMRRLRRLIEFARPKTEVPG